MSTKFFRRSKLLKHYLDFHPLEKIKIHKFDNEIESLNTFDLLKNANFDLLKKMNFDLLKFYLLIITLFTLDKIKNYLDASTSSTIIFN